MSERLLLDEHFSAAIAAALAEDGFEVKAVVGDPALAGQPDEVLLRHAVAGGWRIVTDNVPDCLALATAAQATGQPSAALLLIGSRHSPRGRSRTGAMIQALRAWLTTGATAPEQDWLRFTVDA